MGDIIKNLKKVFNIGKKYNKHFVCFVIGSINAIIINVIYPLFAAKQLLFIADNLYKELIGASVIILSVLLFQRLNSNFITKNTQYYFTGITKDIQTMLGKEILKISTKELDKTSSGIFIQRLTSDTEKLSHIFTKGIGYLTGILSQIGVFISVLILNWKIGIYYFITASIVTFLYIYYSKIATKKDKEYRNQYDKVTSLTSEMIRGIRDIKMLNSKESYVNTLSQNIDLASNKLFNYRDVYRKKDTVVWSTVAIFEFILIIILILFIENNLIAPATALIVFNYHNNIYENLMERIDCLLRELKDFGLSANRVFSILEDKEFSKEEFGDNHLSKINGDFEFKNVYFGYDENDILKDLSFKVNANETVAFVGKSGSGKTTIFSLLCKLYNINKGEILIDGNNIKDLDEYSIRNNITIISQNPYIFNMTIKDNLKLVKEDLTDKEMKEACKLACLNEFIETLPNKYDTVVGEGGVMLSGGQRQRLAIARAFIQKTEIILFDEATSALDNETQSYIQQAIDNMKKDYTILIIAHRLSTIVNADRIIVIDDGKVVGEGTHKQLLSKNKIYKKLYESEIDNS